jgi:hypothetical protein
VIEFPTTVGTIVGRWACDGPADLGAMQALQNGLSLEPHGRPAPLKGIPAPAAVPRQAGLLRADADLDAGLPAVRA